MIAFVIAIPVVYLSYTSYFLQELIPPVARVYAKTIEAGAQPGIASSLLIWAIPGAIVQFIGGPKRQLGVLLATGLLINNALAGWAVLAGIALRILIIKRWGIKAARRWRSWLPGLLPVMRYTTSSTRSFPARENNAVPAIAGGINLSGNICEGLT